MSERMLVTQTLDERDLLAKKIGDKISKMKMIDVKKRNEEKTADSRLTPEEFSSAASATYQSVMDLIDRFRRIDAAIVASNAANTVKTSYGEFTVAGAIALRNRLKGNGIYDTDGAFETRREYLRTHALEGIVFWKDGAPRCKIKRKDFGFKWPIKQVDLLDER